MPTKTEAGGATVGQQIAFCAAIVGAVIVLGAVGSRFVADGPAPEKSKTKLEKPVDASNRGTPPPASSGSSDSSVTVHVSGAINESPQEPFAAQGRGKSTPVMVPVNGFSFIEPWKERFPKQAMIEADELGKAKSLSRYRILDVCPRSQFKTFHVPGAVWVDHVVWADEFAHNKNQPLWEKRLGALGIDVDTPVAVYDSGNGDQSAFIRSVLIYWGVKEVVLLDGGWPAWLYHGGHQESTEVAVAPKRCRLSPAAGSLAGKFR